MIGWIVAGLILGACVGVVVYEVTLATVAVVKKILTKVANLLISEGTISQQNAAFKKHFIGIVEEANGKCTKVKVFHKNEHVKDIEINHQSSQGIYKGQRMTMNI